MDKKYKGKEVYEEQMNQLRGNYKAWKERKRISGTPFFMVYTDFKDTHLKEMSGGSLKLYVYLGFHANNFTGESWHSSDTIADYFGVDVRTVKKWFAELEDRNMVTRIQTGYKRAANTFLLPYGEEKEGKAND